LKLFIFKPHNSWSYCGGAYIIIAADFAAAATLLKQHEEHENNLSPNELSKLIVDQTESPVNDTENHWVLVESFPVADPTPRVVFCSYNYA
jgi:hypothetical protein